METQVSILVVDDDRLVLSTLADGLRDAGFIVQMADSAQAALDLCRQSRPHLALLDARMPGVSGVELAHSLRAMDIPFLFLSAYSDAPLVEKALAEGALGYLMKPMDVPRLLPSLQAALRVAGNMERLRLTAEQLSTALEGERDTSVCVGLLMERYRLSREQAFDKLRGCARSERRRIQDVAQEALQSVEQLNRLAR